MELKIYDKQGTVKMTASPDSSSQWNHEVGVENVVTANFTTWEFIILEAGWYILVEGQKFRIKSEYRPKHVHNSKYTYNLKFYGREHDTEDLLFCRLNQGDDDLESVFAYDGTPMEFLVKVVANMNRNSDGVVWKVGEAITANRQTINFNGLYCWDALGEIARTFGTEWWMDGEYLNLSKCIRGESVSLGYGEGLKSGLTQNENTNAVKWFTRLIPVGSSKNIDKGKYGYSNLQLPEREKYIDINTQYGLKEYREEAAFSEIFPHRIGTISSVRSEDMTNAETDNYTVYYVKDSSLTFNPDDYMIGGEVIHVTFNTGALAGKEFEVNWNNDTSEFEIINQYPDDESQLPGGNLVPSINDTYVLSNISMPDEYNKAAEKEYKEAVDAFLTEYSKDISIYSGNTDYIYVAKNNVPLLLGQRIRLLSEQYFEEGSIESRITRVSRKLNNLGDASIDCSNAIASSWKSSVDSSLNQLQFSVAKELAESVIDILKTSDTGNPNDYNVLSALRSLNTFLRKDKEDTAKKKITFEEGWKTKDFASGLTGFGANIDKDGQAELESLFIRTFLEVPGLRYNRVTIRMGDEINSVSAGEIESVTPDKDADGNVLTTGILTLKLEDTDFGTLEYDDIVFQIYSDLENKENNSTETSDDGIGNRHMKGFATVMFKVLEVSGERNEIIRYSLRPLSDNWKKQIHPYKFGTFSQRGNFSNKDRQIIVYKGLYPKPYTRYMDGVNDWEFTPLMIGMQLGYLGNLSVDGQTFEGYSAYLNNVYFTGMIRQLYIPEWIEGSSAAQNGTLVYMGGNHYVSKGDTDEPPLFGLLNENGEQIMFEDDDETGDIYTENNEDYDPLAKKGEDGVGISSTGLFYMLTADAQKPLADSAEWGTAFIQPTDLKPYLWKKTVVAYSNLTKQTTIECISVRGKDGTSVNIKGSYDSESELLEAYPNGPTNDSDAYIVNGDLYVWTGAQWKNVGSIKGEAGDTAHVHIKYANETASGTEVTVGGQVYVLSFTANDGEDVGDWLGVYADHTPADSMNISDYKWKNTKGDKGTDGTAYWFDSPIDVIHFSTDGTPTPSSFVVTFKKSTGSGDVVNCADYYLATWKYDGNWQLVSVTSSKASSVTIIPSATTVYKQYRVTAHSTSSVSSSTAIIKEKAIGVAVDGSKGDAGEDGLFVYDTGLYDSTRAYYYKKIDGKVRRDKILFEIGGGFYNFLVRNRTSDDSTGLVNTPPTSINGDENWEVMSQFRSVIANTLFGTNANIGGFMVTSQKMESQSTVTDADGVEQPSFELNGSAGTMTMRQAEGTVWQVDESGVQTAGSTDGERIVIDPNSKSISIFDADGTERTEFEGVEYTRSQLLSTSATTVTVTDTTSGSAISSGILSNSSTFALTNSFTTTSVASLIIPLSGLKIMVSNSGTPTIDTSTPTAIPNGRVDIVVKTTVDGVVSEKRVTTYHGTANTIGGTHTVTYPAYTYTIGLTAGTHQLIARVVSVNGNNAGYTKTTGYWTVGNIAVSVESYMSRHFANGMMLSKSSLNYFMAMVENDNMIVEAVSNGTGLRVSNSTLQYKYKNSEWCDLPISLLFLKVTVTGYSNNKSTFNVSYKTYDESSVTVTEVTEKEGLFNITLPSAWGLSADTMHVQATGFGRYRGGSSNGVCWASVLSVSATQIQVVTSYNTNNEFDSCGFFLELKKI